MLLFIEFCVQFVYPKCLSGYNPPFIDIVMWGDVEHMTRMTTKWKALLFNCRRLVMSLEYEGIHNGETGLYAGDMKIWRKENDSTG